VENEHKSFNARAFAYYMLIRLRYERSAHTISLGQLSGVPVQKTPLPRT